MRRAAALVAVWTFAVVALAFALLDFTRPAHVRHCSVARVGDNSVFTGEIHNNRSRIVTYAGVMVMTSGARGSAAEYYVLEGPIAPGSWVRRSAAGPRDYITSTLDQRLGGVTECSVWDVRYDDGTYWEAPSPL